MVNIIIYLYTNDIDNKTSIMKNSKLNIKKSSKIKVNTDKISSASSNNNFVHDLKEIPSNVINKDRSQAYTYLVF